MTIIHKLNSMSLVQKHCFNKEMYTHTKREKGGENLKRERKRNGGRRVGLKGRRERVGDGEGGREKILIPHLE